MKAFIREHKFYLLILFFLSLAIMIFAGFYTNKLGHDMGFHVSNIENLSAYLDFSKGRFFAPDISENIGGNLGYGLYLFYPSLPHLLYAYFYKFLSLFSIDILTSILIMNILITVISTFLMYLLSYKISKNKKFAFLTGLIFLLFPYRLSNIFIRYALNESLLFLFIPLILLGLYEWKNHNIKKFYFLFCIGYIGMIYSHLMMTLFFTILLIPFPFIFHRDILNKKCIVSFLKAILFVSIFVSPILVGFFENMNGEYLVYLKYYMTSPALVLENTMNITSYLLPKFDNWSVQIFIPILVLILAVGSITYFIRNKEKNSFYLFLFIIIFISILMTTSLFP